MAKTIISYTVSDGSLSDTGLITVSVTGVNDAPVVADSQTETINEDTVLTVTPSAIDIDGDTLTITVNSVTEAGTLAAGVTTVDANAKIVYTPTANFNGETIITYTANDGSLSDTGVITVSVTGVNDAPVAVNNQVALGIEDTILTVSPSASDAEGDTITITVDSVTEAGGVVTGVTTVNSNGEIVYSPTASFDGETIISYTASDGKFIRYWSHNSISHRN